VSDDETIAFLRSSVAREAGLSEGQSRRLKGETVAELRADAKAMRAELDMPPLDDEDGGRQRDASGRFQTRSMNQAIRQAAGR
jgi:hypothetical protein